MSLSILHLSDFHAGPGELEDEDQKSHVSGIERSRYIDRLARYLRGLYPRPDYVVITGDFTNRGNEAGFQETRQWLLQQIHEGFLPDPSRFLITPGNHDVAWGIEQSANGWHKERYKLFWNNFGAMFPHAHINEMDPELRYDRPFIDVPTAAARPGIIGGLRTRQEGDEIIVTESHPFLLDIENEILIFAFNSSLACGVYQAADPKVVNALDQLRGSAVDDDARNAVDGLGAAYKKGLLVDAGYIGNQQIDYFSQLMARLKYRDLGPRYSRLTKIAILHHHVSHLWNQQLEVKSFESVLDAAKLKQALVECGFDLVLHGHKHTNHVAFDASVIPLSGKHQLNPICVISAGTIGGYPRTGHQQTFKLINFNEDRGPRSFASLREIPLWDRADPITAIKNDSVVYNIKLSSRLEDISDLSGIRLGLQERLFQAIAAEARLNTARMHPVPLSPSRSDIALNFKEPLFDHAITFSNQVIFYIVFLLSRELTRDQKAHVYASLIEAKALAEHENKTCLTVLLLGNLEETRFFEGTSKGEIKRSIEELERWLAPAVASGILEVRKHQFAQDEAEKIARRLA